MPPKRPLVIAHAGGAGLAPENTLAALRASLAAGVDAIEVDVRATADGVPVLIHDSSVDRTTNGQGEVATLTLAQLQALDAGQKLMGEPFRNQRVPTLAEALALTAGRAPLLLEIKVAGIEAAVLRAVQDAKPAAGMMVTSFDGDALLAAHRQAPDLPCFLIPSSVELTAAFLDEVAAQGLAGLSIEHARVDAPLVEAAHRRGLRLFAWTVDEPAEALRLCDAGVDGIITNVPPSISRALDRR